MGSVIMGDNVEDQGGASMETELDRLKREDPRRLRLQLALGKETADRVLRDEARKEREAAAAWEKMSSAEKILSLLHGKIEDDLLARIKEILEAK